jgi:DNA ligase-associated metallophosphoesterase
LSRTQKIRLAGLDLVPDLSGALHVPELRTVLVADLHLEKGTSLARRGAHLPPYDTRESLRQLAGVIAALKPERLIFLGDSFHDGEARDRIDEADLATVRALSGAQETIWIAGNHDPVPPADIGGSIAHEVALGPLTLRHAPQALGPGEFEIAGHLHPAAALSQRGRRIRCKCFIADGRRIVMPAFGSFTGALSVSAEPFAPLFQPGNYHVWMLGGRAVHRFPAVRVR